MDGQVVLRLDHIREDGQAKHYRRRSISAGRGDDRQAPY